MKYRPNYQSERVLSGDVKKTMSKLNYVRANLNNLLRDGNGDFTRVDAASVVFKSLFPNKKNLIKRMNAARSYRDYTEAFNEFGMRLLFVLVSTEKYYLALDALIEKVVGKNKIKRAYKKSKSGKKREALLKQLKYIKKGFKADKYALLESLGIDGNGEEDYKIKYAPILAKSKKSKKNRSYDDYMDDDDDYYNPYTALDLYGLDSDDDYDSYDDDDDDDYSYRKPRGYRRVNHVPFHKYYEMVNKNDPEYRSKKKHPAVVRVEEEDDDDDDYDAYMDDDMDDDIDMVDKRRARLNKSITSSTKPASRYSKSENSIPSKNKPSLAEIYGEEDSDIDDIDDDDIDAEIDEMEDEELDIEYLEEYITATDKKMEVCYNEIKDVKYNMGSLIEYITELGGQLERVEKSVNENNTVNNVGVKTQQVPVNQTAPQPQPKMASPVMKNVIENPNIKATPNSNNITPVEESKEFPREVPRDDPKPII